MEKTWKPTVAGILAIVAGAIGLMGCVGMIIAGSVMSVAGARELPEFVPSLLFGTSLPLAIVGIVAIVGGIYALKRRIWGLALAGSIVALLPSWPLGIAAIVFTVMSKNEFE